MRVVDSHVHFWRIGGPGQTWPDAEWPLLYSDFGMAELRAAVGVIAASAAEHPSDRTAPIAGGVVGQPSDLTAGAAPAGAGQAAIGRVGVGESATGAALPAAASTIELEGVVLVQSQPDYRDTDWILTIARDEPLVQAVVGWVDLESPTAAARIADLVGKPKLRGLRPMLQAIEDTTWILRRELQPALQAMVQHGLRFDALVQPRHLPVLLEFARRWPKLPIVIDHGAKPHIPLGEIEPWQAQLAQLSLLPNIYCKLSGLRTEQTAGAPSAELEPFIRQLVACFPGRLMWGSDWPVLLHARDSYADWLECCLHYAGVQDESQLDSLFSGAAREFYGLG